jgi:hypothetical protein
VGLLLCVFLRRVGKLNGDYQSRSQLSATSSLRNNLLSKLNPFEDEFVVDYECGFRRNRPCTDHIITNYNQQDTTFLELFIFLPTLYMFQVQAVSSPVTYVLL